MPLRVHGRTCREEACAGVLAAYCCAEALRLRCRRRPARRPPQPPRGRALAPAHRCGAFTGPLFITLRKSEALFSPSTRYRDLALGPSLSHWESQSTTTAASATGQRYIHHEARGSRVPLFVREQRRQGGVTEPFVRLGFARYESHEGERICPRVAIRWRLEREIPAAWLPGCCVAHQLLLGIAEALAV
ncbi:MAG: DUF3427 domain-containing protein [Synechococcaceae cyanobacterium]